MRLIFALLLALALAAAPAFAEEQALTLTPEQQAALEAIDWEALAEALTAVRPELPADPQIGEWYAVAPKGAVCADGSPWHGLIRLGTANRVMVYFFGGGVSLSPENSRNLDAGFFLPTVIGQDFITDGGIFVRDAQNPFADWTILAIEYGTGDFHTGTGEYRFTDENGEERIVYHNGYNNYSRFMDAVAPLLGTPDALVVTGSSAGGFATALLTDDVMSRFPDTHNVTACVDAGLLRCDGWRSLVETLWQAPPEICERLTGDDIVLDSLRALHKKRGDAVKILFVCTTRDSALQVYQAYIDDPAIGALPQPEPEYGERFYAILFDFVDSLLREIPGSGAFIFDNYGAPYEATQHMVLPGNPFAPRNDGVCVADWLMDAVEGEVRSYGLWLLGL